MVNYPAGSGRKEKIQSPSDVIGSDVTGMKKRKWAAGLIIACVLCFSGCGQGEEQHEEALFVLDRKESDCYNKSIVNMLFSGRSINESKRGFNACIQYIV